VELTLFVCGDVVTGRGIDQILPRPSERKAASSARSMWRTTA
jgi:hypothetical protein